MPVTLRELKNSRARSDSETKSSQRLSYMAMRSYDDLEIKAATLSAIPATFNSQILKAISYTHEGAGIWLVDADYEFESERNAETTAEPAGATTPVTVGFSFSTSGGTQHITQSLETVLATAAAGVALPDFKQAIGVTRDRVEGTDIVVPKLEFAVTRKRASVTMEYIRTLSRLTGTVNDAAVFTFASGELLYLGADGNYEPSDGSWTVGHKFGGSPNLTDIEVGNGITMTAKNGWDYLWVGYADSTDANVLFQKPVYAFVERVYRYEDFADLEL